MLLRINQVFYILVEFLHTYTCQFTMRKLLKKSPANKKAAKDYRSINYNMSFNDRWHWTCDRTKDKFHTVVPQHNAPQPATKEFLENYDLIDWGHDKKEKVEA